jgi:hemolysin activation/secretion protein
MRAGAFRYRAMFHNPRNRPWLVISALALASATDAHAAESMPLTAAVIRGSSVYTPAQLFAAYRDELGRPVDDTRARAVIGAVGDLYERDGYARPKVRADRALPAPGIMRLTVEEPQITEVVIEGDAGPHRQRLEDLSSQLERMQPVRRSEVQRVLGQMRELPGLSVVANTRRDDEHRNGYALAVNAAFDPVDAVVGVSNRGTEEIGPVFVNGQAVANGWLTGREKLGLLLTAATDVDEYRGIGAFVDTPINSRGTRAFLLAFRSDAEPSTASDAPVDEYLRERATLRITHPLAGGTRMSLSLAAAFDVDDFEIRRDGAELREERLRVIQLGARAGWRGGERTQYDATLELRQGLDALSSGLQAEDLAHDPRRADFLLTRVQLAQVTRLGDAWSVRADVLAQHTAYVLPYSERFKVGGERLGRGFEVSEIAGDRGAGAKLEVRRSFAAEVPFALKPSAYAFYDIGATWNQDVGGRASAATGGLGIAAQAGRYSGYFELAKPLTRPDVEGKRGATVFGGLSVRL